jgi:ADP-heptose:LPS heptosyltransferase
MSTIKNLYSHQDQLQDFSDTAALICEMDIVISTCTSIAHLSGALHHPTIVLLPYSADYRWMDNRIESPWYPSLKLIRQRSVNDWSQALIQLKSTIKSLLE